MNPRDLSTPFWRRFTDEGKRSLDQTRSLYDEVEKQYRASPWSKPNALERTADAALQIIEEDGACEYAPLRDAIRKCFAGILSLEDQIFARLELDFSQPLTLREQMGLNAWLRNRKFFLENDDAIDTILLEALRQTLKPFLKAGRGGEESHLTVPLFSVLASPAATIETILSTYLKPEHATYGVFTSLAETLQRNLYKVSGVSLDAPGKKPHIYPSAANMRSRDLIDAYLQGTPFRDLFFVPIPFELPAEQRFAGHWIIAPPGRGKTTCLHGMLADDLQRDAAIVLMDSKGDLIEPFRKMRSIADRLIVIDPDPKRPIAINPLDIPKTEIGKAVELLEYLFASLLEFELTPSQSLLFRNVSRLLVTQFRHPNLELFREILSDGWKIKYAGPVGRLEPRLKDFFYNDFETTHYQERRQEVLRRLQLLLDNETMNAMLSAPTTRFTFDEALDAGKIVIINNSKEKLGDQGSEFFGRFFIAQLLATAQRRSGRPQSKKKPVFCYIDECQTVIARDEKISTILDECRSQRIGLILSHQRTTQIKNENVLSALQNCAIRFANSDAEAKRLAASLRTSQQFLESLGQGQFAAYVRDTTKAATAIDVIRSHFAAEDRLSATEQQELADKTMKDYGRESVSKPLETLDVDGLSAKEPKRKGAKKQKKPDSASEW